VVANLGKIGKNYTPTQNLDGEMFNIRKLNDLEVRTVSD
jgi:hypothetical protein